MIHFLAFSVKRFKKAHFNEVYSIKKSTFQNFYANRLKSKKFYSIKSALFRISMQMKIHLLYSWINLRGANPPPPPPYRNNLYKITYVINFSRYSLKIRGGGGFNPPLIYLPQVRGGGGGGVATPPPTFLLWRPWHMRIYQFMHLLYLFMYLFIRLFSYSFIHSFSMVFQSISVQIRCTCTCILQH